MRILLSAYACLPNKGSEDGVGWNWLIHLSNIKDVEIVLLTRTANYQYLINRPELIEKNVVLYPYDIHWLSKGLFKNYSQIKDWLYFRIWQKAVFYHLKRYIGPMSIDIIHHATFNEFRTPGDLWKLKIPFVFGPIGSGENFNSRLFVFCEGISNVLREIIRSTFNEVFKHSFHIKRAFKKASHIIVANTVTKDFIKLDLIGVQYTQMPEIGINQEDIIADAELIKRFITHNETVNILWAGRIVYRKGLIVLIKAIELLNKEGVTGFRVTVIGDGILKKRYENYCKSKHVDNIEFIGKLEHVKLMKEYEKADIFAFSSIRDTGGSVILEAMAKGLPVIALDQYGAKDIITERSGIKVFYKDADDLIIHYKNALELLIKEDKIRESMSLYALQTIKENHLWQTKADQVVEIYKQIMGCNGEVFNHSDNL